MSDTPPPGMHDFVASHMSDAGAPPPGMEDFVSDQLKEDKYSSVGQKIATGAEGVARGLTAGLSDIPEVKVLGIPREDIEARAETNPEVAIPGNIAGGAALIAGTGGLGGLAEAAGLSGVGAAAAAGTGEGAAFAAGDLISDKVLGDPNLNAQKVTSELGMGTLIGLGAGVFGHGISKAFGKSGLPKGSVADAVAKQEDSIRNAAEISNVLAKPPTPNEDVIAAAQKIGAPLHEGMVADDEWTKRLTDALIRTDPTFEGKRIGAIYNEGWEKSASLMDQIAGQGQLSKRQLGEALQESLSDSIRDEAAPFNDLYGAIKEETSDIPLKEGSAPSKDILEIPEIKRSFKSGAANLAKDVSEEISNLKTVDDLRAYQTELNSRLSPTAPPQERRILGLVQEKLDGWERSAIKDFAKESAGRVEANPEQIARLNSLLQRIDETDAQYRPFKKKINELSEWLGKGRVYGPKDAAEFISNRLEPEDMVNKLFSKKYTRLNDFMEKHFPEQSALLKQYQKDVLREQSLVDGKFSPKRFVDKVLDLEPEVQKSIFAPDELEKINAVKDYLGGFPKNFNPSGTANKSSLMHFLESPKNAAIANVRDLFISAKIRNMAELPAHLRPNPVDAGQQIGNQMKKLAAVESIAQKTSRRIAQGAKAIFSEKGEVPRGKFIAGGMGYEERTKRIEELASQPDVLGNHLSNHTAGLHDHVPNVAQGVQYAITASVHYLNAKIPRPNSQLMLSEDWEPSESQKDQFNETFDIVNDPISIMSKIKSGNLLTSDVEAVQATHPDLFKEMQMQVLSQLKPDRAMNLSGGVKRSLGLFLGQPLDESMLPKVSQSNQLIFAGSNAARNTQSVMPKKRSSQTGLSKLKLSNRISNETDSLSDRRD